MKQEEKTNDEGESSFLFDSISFIALVYSHMLIGIFVKAAMMMWFFFIVKIFNFSQLDIR